MSRSVTHVTLSRWWVGGVLPLAARADGVRVRDGLSGLDVASVGGRLGPIAWERDVTRRSLRERGRATDAKLQAIDEIRAPGGHAQVCYGLDCALAILEGWGLAAGPGDVR